MELLEYSVFFGCGIVSFVLGVLLLFVRVAVGDVHPYRRAKKFLGLSAIFNFEVNAAVVCMMLLGVDYTLLDIYFVPMAYYTQLYLMCFSLLAIFHSRVVTRRLRVLFQVPVMLTTLAYVICYVACAGFTISTERYVSFMETLPAYAVTYTLYLSLALSIMFCLFRMVGEARRYRRHIENYFSDTQLEDGMWTYRIAYVYVGYVLFTTFGVFVPGKLCHVVFMSVNTLFLITAVIVIINLHHTFFRTIPAIEVPDEANGEAVDEATESEEQVAETVGVEGRTVTSIVEEWTQRRPLPYMRSGVTLAMAAGEMGISVAVLSYHINHFYGDNFNAWVNRLRVGEIKRILEGEESVTMTELAERAGFTDASAMGKVFKKIAGMPPSVYRSKYASS